MSGPSENIVLEIVDLKKSFGDNHVLNGFSLKLFEGENLVVMGKSGSGKSVMIKCLVGLMQADSGSIRIKEHDIVGVTLFCCLTYASFVRYAMVTLF